MVLRIRLARFGTKRKPIYNIILAQAKSGRDKKPMEVLGTYNPIPQAPLANPDTPELLEDGTKFVPKKQKDVQLDLARTRYWLGVGAQPTEPVEKLLRLVSRVGFLSHHSHVQREEQRSAAESEKGGGINRSGGAAHTFSACTSYIYGLRRNSSDIMLLLFYYAC
jgi:small subunit ribosomal protein S16